jgi:hypothetical protein
VLGWLRLQRRAVAGTDASRRRVERHSRRLAVRWEAPAREEGDGFEEGRWGTRAGAGCSGFRRLAPSLACLATCVPREKTRLGQRAIR